MAISKVFYHLSPNLKENEMPSIIGRKKELQLLERLYKSDKAEFLAIYGRRRVGKTFLISQFFKEKTVYFELTGIKNATTKNQLKNFNEELSGAFFGGQLQNTPDNWQEAFSILCKRVKKAEPSKKVTIFLDELPWLASPRSGFLEALDHAWNRYLSRQPNVVLVVCGSAASWMLKKIVDSQGGFYGRLTAKMKLEPYTLAETELFCKAKGIELEHKQIIELYMAFGGIPKYLEIISKGKSPVQTIQEACFAPNAPLAYEFPRLFSSLFDHAETHLTIVKALAKQRSGLSQSELIDITKLKSGGGLTRTLEELEASGFITTVPNFEKKKRESLYRLIDEYSLFYLTWIMPSIEGSLKDMQEFYWQQAQDSPRYHAWGGYTFEGICLKHIKGIVFGLGISGISVKASSWKYRAAKDSKENGTQIDLVIERADNCINLCEIKYSNAPYVVTKEYAEKLRWKKECFRTITGTRKSLFTTLITPFGVFENAQYAASVDNQITMDSLFISFG